MGHGYSPGPSRSHPMLYSEAEATFARARDKDAGKPLPGANVRLYKDLDEYYVSYHDTPVVTIYPDNTYLLDHGGYPSRMTKIRMVEYSPVAEWGDVYVSTVGKREYKSRARYEEPWLGYDNLSLTFPCSAVGDIEQSLLYLYHPEKFKRACTLEFPREQLHVDSEGVPVLESLISELAPQEWRHLLQKRLQPWSEAARMPGASVALPPRAQARAFSERWPRAGVPGQQTAQLRLVRRAWNGNRVVASIWVYQKTSSQPKRFRWVIPATKQSGQSTRLDLAVKKVNRELAKAGWSSAPPLLTDVLGNLRGSLGAPLVDPRQPTLPFGSGNLLLDRPVLRVHWMEPWSTTEQRQKPDQHGYEDWTQKKPLKRGPLPGSLRWPGPEDVRVWFELVDGTAVGVVHDGKTDKDHVIIRHTGEAQGTDWAIPGVLAAGLLATVLAWFA